MSVKILRKSQSLRINSAVLKMVLVVVPKQENWEVRKEENAARRGHASILWVMVNLVKHVRRHGLGRDVLTAMKRDGLVLERDRHRSDPLLGQD
jgi:hypothetical protein